MDDKPYMMHSLASVARLETVARSQDVALEHMHLIADHLVKHAHPLGEPFFDRWQRAISMEVPSEDMAETMSRFTALQAAYAYVRKHVQFENLSDAYREDCYRPDNTTLVRKEGSKNLLVVWSTMYNNFGVSTAAAIAMLRTLDCHVLVLKDAQTFFFLKGVRGFASSFGEIAPNIEKLAARIGAENISFLAYSSGAYTAIASSLQLDCKAYIGFSQTCLQLDEPEQQQWISVVVKQMGMSAEALFAMCALSEPVPPRQVKRTLFVGDKNASDIAQSNLVAERLKCTLVSVPDTGHNTVMALLSRGDFLNVIESHLAAASPGLN